MYVVGKLTNKLKPNAMHIAEINLDSLTASILNEAIQHTYIVYDAMGGNNGVAKGKEFVSEVLLQLKDNINS